MRVDIEEINPVKKLLKIEIPDSIVKKERADVYSDLNKKVRIPGFRQGKIPIYILERRYGKAVEEELTQRLVSYYYIKAIKENGIIPLGSPAIKEIELGEDSSLRFKATVEVKPKIELIDYQGIGLKIKRDNKIIVSDKDVDNALKVLQEQYGQLYACGEDEVIERKSYVIIDYKGYIDGECIDEIKGEDYLFQLGTNAFVPEIEQELIGKRRDDEIEKKVVFPSDFYNETIAGKEVLFKIRIKEIKEKVLSDIDDDFAKEVGEFNTLDELKAKLREELEAKLKREERLREKDRIIKELIALHSFELPSLLVERELREIIAYLRPEVKEGDVKKAIDALFAKEEYRSLARDRVKGRLILETIAEKENIEVKGEEVEEELRLIAKERRSTPEMVKRYIIANEGSLDGVKARIVEDKVIDLILSKTTYEEKKRDEEVIC